MTAHLRAWLEKATLTTADLDGGSNGGLLSPEQAREFIRMAVDASVLMSEVRVETNASPKFQVPRIGFTGRILRKGTEATRLADGDRVKPATGLVELSTDLYKGEVLVSDEFFEDNIERDGAADTLMAQIAEAVGKDIEEIAIKADTDRTGGEDQTLDQTDGIIKSFQDGLPGGQVIDASAETDAEAIFRKMLNALPARFRRDPSALRIYAPVALVDAYHDQLSARGTPLGDTAVTDNIRGRLAFRGVPIVDVPLLSGTDLINSASVDYGTFAFLTHPKNIIAGWHRRVRVEKFRDPREGATSFLPSVRFDVKLAEPYAGTLATDIPSL